MVWLRIFLIWHSIWDLVHLCEEEKNAVDINPNKSPNLTCLSNVVTIIFAACESVISIFITESRRSSLKVSEITFISSHVGVLDRFKGPYFIFLVTIIRYHNL